MEIGEREKRERGWRLIYFTSSTPSVARILASLDEVEEINRFERGI
jgi:hypothetical protein